MIVQYIMIQYGRIIRIHDKRKHTWGSLPQLLIKFSGSHLFFTSNQIDIFINTFITVFSLACLCQTTFYVKAIIILN